MSVKEEVVQKLAEVWAMLKNGTKHEYDPSVIENTEWLAKRAGDIITTVRNSMKWREVTDDEICGTFNSYRASGLTISQSLIDTVRGAIAESLSPIQEQEPTQDDKIVSYLNRHAMWSGFIATDGRPCDVDLWRIAGTSGQYSNLVPSITHIIAAEEAAKLHEIKNIEAEIAVLQAKLLKLKGGA